MGNSPYTAENTLKSPGVETVERRWSSDEEIVHIGEDQAFGCQDVKGGDVNNEQEGGARGALRGAHWDRRKDPISGSHSYPSYISCKPHPVGQMAMTYTVLWQVLQ